MTGRALSIVIAVSSLVVLAPGARAAAQDRRALHFAGVDRLPAIGVVDRAAHLALHRFRGGPREAEHDRAAARLGSDAGSREVAADVGASAVVEGRVTRRGRRFTLRLVVRDASTGSELAQESFAGRNPGALRAANPSGS